jgi:hypothetical protein
MGSSWYFEEDIFEIEKNYSESCQNIVRTLQNKMLTKSIFQ